jgi:LysM repeat protein
MTRSRSVLVLIVVPAIVSLLVTLLVLNLWDRQRPQQHVITLPTPSGTSQIPPREIILPEQTGEAGETGEPGEESAATEEATEPPPPTECENPIHTVDAGQVLGGIAESYGVSIDDIVALNQQIDPSFNPDILSVGQQIAIPLCGIPTPAPTETPTDTPVPTRNIPEPIPTATALPQGAISVEIARVLNPGDITSEAVEIVNRGTPVELTGWTLSDGGRNEFEFPTFRLFASGGVTVYTGVGENTPIDLFWGLDEAVWEIGATVFLYDADGELQDEYEIEEP